MEHIRVWNHRARVPQSIDGKEVVVVDTTSRSTEAWSRGLSPFYIGPVPIYDDKLAANMENAWQYCKVYHQHLGADGNPSPDYWRWATAGWAAPEAKRYPMGRGAAPAYSWWNGERLGYIDARKRIYCPLYAHGVVDTPAFRRLVETYEQCVFEDKILLLRDFDGYDHTRAGLTLQQVLNNPQKKMGHAFVLAMLLTDQRLWQ